MPGHYGFSQVTVKNLQIVEIQKEHSLLAVKGAIPGANGRLVRISRSNKN
jgi:large subunit ribosomal protein L3